MIELMPWSYCASIEVNAPAKRAYAFMADGNKQTNWALGSWNRQQLTADTFRGTSLLDGTEQFVKLVPRPDLLLVDYFCGTSLDRLVWMVESRVVPGDLVGLGPEMSLINMTTWRDATTDPRYWALVNHVWLTEIHLIKQLIEATP